MNRSTRLTLVVALALAGCKATPPGRFERAVAAQVKRRIVLYIRHLPPAGSLGEPAMYSAN